MRRLRQRMPSSRFDSYRTQLHLRRCEQSVPSLKLLGCERTSSLGRLGSRRHRRNEGARGCVLFIHTYRAGRQDSKRESCREPRSVRSKSVAFRYRILRSHAVRCNEMIVLLMTYFVAGFRSHRPALRFEFEHCK